MRRQPFPKMRKNLVDRHRDDPKGKPLEELRNRDEKKEKFCNYRSEIMRGKTTAHVCSACTSLVCMAQMGAMTAASGAAMGAMSAASTGSVPFITLIFQAVGLGFLLLLPSTFYQIVLVTVLVVTIAISYFSYGGHKSPGPLGLTVTSSLLLYGSIYFFISEPLYWVSFALLLASGIWSYRISIRRGRLRHKILKVKPSA